MTDADRIMRELEAERKRQGLTYYAVAKAAGGMSPIGAERVLTGDREPKLSTVVRLAAALGKKLKVDG